MGHVWFVQAESILVPFATSGASSVRVRWGARRKRRAKMDWRGSFMVGLVGAVEGHGVGWSVRRYVEGEFGGWEGKGSTMIVTEVVSICRILGS